MKPKLVILLISTVVAVLIVSGGIVFIFFPNVVTNLAATAHLSWASGESNEDHPAPKAFPELGTAITVRKNRTCNTCVGGNFLMYRWFMQDPRVDQRMAWGSDWEYTDCLQGVVQKYHECQTTCVTILLQKRVEVPKGTYEGMLMECADDLIYNSPDINITNGLYQRKPIYFRRNATYRSDRSIYRITYMFSTLSSKDSHEVARLLQDLMLPGISPLVTTTGTKVIWIILGVGFGMACFGVLWFCHCFTCKKKSRTVRLVNLKIDDSMFSTDVEFLEMASRDDTYGRLSLNDDYDDESFTGSARASVDMNKKKATYKRGLAQKHAYRENIEADLHDWRMSENASMSSVGRKSASSFQANRSRRSASGSFRYIDDGYSNAGMDFYSSHEEPPKPKYILPKF